MTRYKTPHLRQKNNVKTPSQVKRMTQYKTAPTKQRSSNLCPRELLLLLASCWGLKRVTHELSLDSLDISLITTTQIRCTWVGKLANPNSWCLQHVTADHPIHDDHVWVGWYYAWWSVKSAWKIPKAFQFWFKCQVKMWEPSLVAPLFSFPVSLVSPCFKKKSSIGKILVQNGFPKLCT